MGLGSEMGFPVLSWRSLFFKFFSLAYQKLNLVIAFFKNTFWLFLFFPPSCPAPVSLGFPLHPSFLSIFMVQVTVVSFWDQLTLLNTILFCYSNYFCKFHSFSFLDNWIASRVHICHAFLIQAPAEGQIGWLHSHAIVNRTTENMGVWVSLWQDKLGNGDLGGMPVSYPFATSKDPGLVSVVIALVSTLPTVGTWPAYSTHSPVSRLFPSSQPFCWGETESHTAFEFAWHRWNNGFFGNVQPLYALELTFLITKKIEL